MLIPDMRYSQITVLGSQLNPARLLSDQIAVIVEKGRQPKLPKSIAQPEED